MFTHIMVGTNDLARSARFYDATLGVLGITKVMENDSRAFYRDTANPGSAAFAVVKPIDGEPACHANGGTIGLKAKDAATVDAWHAAGLANGGSDDGAPGVRPMIERYGAYLRDPEGNKLCVFVPAGATA
jgi:catechol 2,3-dioxygenase-like lactoylglutathione lyase family enzyme